MNTWFISDEHYYHSNILMWRDDKARRKFASVDKMHRYIREHHNEVVQDGDVVYHLGDFTFSKNYRDIQHLLEKLKGRHILVLGNHDWFRPFEYVEMGFESVHTSLMIEGYMVIHDPAVAGVLTHQKVIHGHTHGLGLQLGSNSYSVSVEMHDFYPVNFNQIKEAL